VDTPYVDEWGDPVSFEDKFGPDVLEGLRCNERRSNARMVMQVNAYDVGGRPYGFRNLPNIIKDLEITHGIENSGGWPFVSNDPTTNNYIDMIQSYIDDPNVDVYYLTHCGPKASR
jgi:hypothetical protein